VFAGIFGNGSKLPRTEENFVGAASLIIWTVAGLALFKYGAVVLRADDGGQGVHARGYRRLAM
jgi:K+ transporter